MFSYLIRLTDGEIFRAFGQLFEFPHLLPLGLMVVFFIIFLRFRKTLPRVKYFPRLFREALGYLLVFAPLLDTWVAAASGGANWMTELPFNALYVLSFLMGLVLWKKNQLGFERLSYLAIVVSTYHLLFPSYHGDAFSLRYVLYYLTSLGLLLSVIYLHIVDQMKFSSIGLLRSMLCSHILITAVLAFNLFAGTNYWYLLQAPDNFWSPLIILSDQLGLYLFGYLILLYGSYGLLHAVFHRKQILVFYRAKLGDKKV